MTPSLSVSMLVVGFDTVISRGVVVPEWNHNTFTTTYLPASFIQMDHQELASCFTALPQVHILIHHIKYS